VAHENIPSLHTEHGCDTRLRHTRSHPLPTTTPCKPTHPDKLTQVLPPCLVPTPRTCCQCMLLGVRFECCTPMLQLLQPRKASCNSPVETASRCSASDTGATPGGVALDYNPTLHTARTCNNPDMLTSHLQSPPLFPNHTRKPTPATCSVGMLLKCR
jgi:hypothetical protein